MERRDIERRRGFDQLPEWKDFRARYADESHADYRLSRLEFDVQQGRSRDHWLTNLSGAVMGYVDLLQSDLLGDGTALKPGILKQILDTQKETPQIIRDTIRETAMESKARGMTTAAKWIWGTFGATIAAVIGSLVYVIATTHVMTPTH